MGLSNKLSCEAGSFSCCCNPHRFFQSELFWLYFPSLEPWVMWVVSLPSSPWFIRMHMWDHLVLRTHAALPESSLPQLPVSTPPTNLDECFFFNSLVVGLTCSWIFWQFWLFFVFKFVVVLLLVVQGGKVSRR